MPDIDPRLKFILVTGSFGAGKSTLARTLEHTLDRWTRVDADFFANQIDAQLVVSYQQRGLRKGPSWRESRMPGYAEALGHVKRLAAEGSPVLLEACIPERREVESFRIAARAVKDGQSRVIQLKCTLETAMRRRLGAVNVPAGWGAPYSRARFRKVYESYTNPLNTFNFDLPDAVVISTDSLAPSEVVQRALDSLQRGGSD